MTDMLRVDYDDVGLRRALAQLTRGIDTGAERAGMDQATDTANAIRGNVPRRSGRLAATVRPVRTDGGGAVTYGGTLPYARYIEGRSHAVERGVAGAPSRFVSDLERMAARETSRL